MKKGITRRLYFMLLAALFLWGFIVPTTQAQPDEYFYWQDWAGGTHAWSDCTNWSPYWTYSAGIDTCPNTPGNNDFVLFNSYGYYWLMTGDVWVVNSGSLDLWALEMDNFRDSYTITLEWQGNSLSAGTETIGDEYEGQSVFHHTGGTNTVNWLYVGKGYDEGLYPSNGHYKLQQPGELMVNNEFIGYQGNGTFTQTSGSHTVSMGLYLGGYYTAGGGCVYLPGTGTFALEGGSLNVSNNETIGVCDSGIGAFTQTGGIHTVAGNSYVASYNGSTGTYSLSAGTHQIDNNLYVGYRYGTDGTYNLSSTGTLSVGGHEHIGQSGDAVFNQTGGTHTVAGTLSCDLEGDETANTVTFNLQGGSLTACDVIVGQDCSFNQLVTPNITCGTTLYIRGGIYNWLDGELTVGTIENRGTFNVSGASGEERYVNRLILEAGSTLNVSGVTLYYNELVDNGGAINTSGGGSVGSIPGANNPPVADANGPYTGTVGSPVSFDGSGSSDPDGDIVLYEWDFDSDGVFDFSSATSPTATHTYPSAGTYTVTLRVTDDGGETDTDTTTASIGMANTPPIANANGPYEVNEGDTVTLDASGSYDPDNGDEIVLYEWDLDNDGEYDDATGITAHKSYEDNGSDTVGLRVTDKNAASDTATAIVTVNNVSPSVGPISIDPEEALVEVDTLITASADFTDPGTLDTHTAVWNWGDGTSEPGTVITGAGFGSVSDGHSYDTAGVYTVELKVTDDDGGSGTSVFQYVVVYDPTGGFVTGGGWIDSPEGAYTPDPTLIGKATFGFVSKYRKGATTPTGNTEFQFKAGDLNFHSDSYDWLVIAGHKAKYKGTGTINGAGNYGFMLSAIDEKLTPSTDIDLFRIKIWDKDNGNAVVYDNQIGDADDDDPTTEIGGGSIVIHKAK